MKTSTMVCTLLTMLALPAFAQSFAPAPRALAPATVTHPCLTPPQGQGPASADCRRACEREPQAAQCPRPAAATAPAAVPNWGAVPSAAPGATGAAPASALPAPGANLPIAGGSVRPGSVSAPVTTRTPASTTRAPLPMPAPPAAGVAASPAAAAPPPGVGGTLSAPAPSALGPVAGSRDAPLVNAAGSTSAPPGGVPVQLPTRGVGTAAANSVAPGKVDSPQFDRVAFDVDFGTVFSGEQVRRTVALNTSARGEAEFGLSIPNAPGFAITEMRVMGQGVNVPPTSTTQAPMPTNTPKPLQDTAVRKVVTSVNAPPWKVQFTGPSELQIDIVYAPKVDLFNNLIGKKMGVLNAGIRNPGGATSASIALRADFRGLNEVNAASLKPRNSPVLIVVEPDVTKFKVWFDVAALGAPIVGVLRQVEDVPGFRLEDTQVRIAAGRSGVVTVNGQFTSLPTSTADARDRVIPVALTWEGGSAKSSVTVIPVPPKRSFHSPMLQGCGVDKIGVMFRVRLVGDLGDYYVKGSTTATTYNSDPLRDAYVQFELVANGKPVCAAYAAHRRVTGKSVVSESGKSYFNGACLPDLENYLAIVRGAVQYRCRPVQSQCMGDFSSCQGFYGPW